MINITSITRQMLWAFVAVMAATGEVSAPAPSAVITQTGLPYFASPQAVNSKPLGQFAFNTHVCLTGKTYTWNRLQFFQYVLPSGELVYTLAGKGIFARDPAGDKSCMSQVASTTLPANIPPPVQRAPQPAPNYVTPPTMAASGEASAQMALAVIAKGGISYYASIQDVGIAPPLGQFAANAHLCMKNAVVTWNGRKFLQFFIQSRGAVYAAFNLEAVSRNPAADRDCELMAQQGNSSTEPTSADSAKAGSLEDGIAAEDRGDWKAASVLLEPLAKQGNPDAQNRIGYMYNSGKGMRQDYAVAMKWYRIAAAQGSAKAQTNIGFMYENGQGVLQDYAEAMKWYRKAADQGIAGAQSNIGVMYANGEGVPQDYAEATKWYRKAADQGNAGAQNNIGSMYANGQGVPQDYTEAIKWWRKAADQGNADAQNNLRIMSTREAADQVDDPYKNLRIMEHALAAERLGDWKSAFLLLKPLAEQGDATAQFDLGFIYENGKGVPQDYAEAMKWYRKAADQGNADAQNNLGTMYANGQGAPQDYTEAIKWWRKAADQGNAHAQELITSLKEWANSTVADVPGPTVAVMAAPGNVSAQTSSPVAANTSGTLAQSPEQLTPEANQAKSNVGSSGTDAGALEAGLAAEKRGDLKAAFLLLKPLAERGSPDAQFHLGLMYDYGKGNLDAPFHVGLIYDDGKGGVRQDSTVASVWYRKAAEQGNAQAQNNLGVTCKKAIGPNPVAYAEAMKWFRKAADQGNSDGQFNLGIMYYDGKGGVRQDYAEAMKWFRKAADQGNADAQEYLTRLNEQMAKSTVADVPDPTLPDPKAARAALSFLERQLTISVNIAGDPEPGLASVQSENGALCHLRCGFHLASGFGEGGVDDAEIEFALSDINIDTIRYDIDGIGRAIISFGTSDGSPRFSRRDREMDMKQNVLSEWSKWEGTDKGFCRAQPDKDSLERAMKALAYLAKSCGAKPSPF